MKGTNIFTPLVLIAALCAVISLTYIGCNNSNQTTTETPESPHAEESHEGHDHETENSAASSEEKSELDKKIDDAIASIAAEKANPSGGMPMGIRTLAQIAQEHPDNERALFQLGLLSIESGQYDKALKRFEKLVSLHPENEEYKLRVEEVKELLTNSAQ